MAVVKPLLPGPRTDRSAVIAVGSIFGVNAGILGSLLPRFPEIADRLGASEATFGLALLAGGVGGVLGSVATPWVVARLGGLQQAIRVAISGMLVGGVLAAAAPSIVVFGLAMGLVGLADGVADPSMNEIALGEQTRRNRSLMGRMHAAWSASLTAFVGIGTLTAVLGVSLPVHLAVTALILATVQVAADAHVRDQPALSEGIDGQPPQTRATVTGQNVRRGVAAVAFLGLAAAWVETPPQDWSALLLSRELGAGAGLAGAGPLTFVAGVLLGRLFMDPMVDRLGGRRVALGAGVMTVVGMGSGLVLTDLTRSAIPLLIGLVLAGVGAAPVFPLMFTAAEDAARRIGRPAGTGGSLVSASSRVGFLLAPLLVGLVAERSGLLIALAITPIGGLLVTFTLPPLLGRDTSRLATTAPDGTWPNRHGRPCPRPEQPNA